MIALRFISIALSVVLFQALCAPWYELGGARPDFVIVILAAFALDGPARPAWFAAAAAGLLVDVLSIDPFGVHLSAALFLTFVIRQGLRGHLGDDAAPRAFLVAAGIAAALTMRPLVLWLLSEERPALSLLPLVILYTLVFATVAIPVAERFAIARGRRQKGRFF